MHIQSPRIRRDLYPHIARVGCPAVKESLYMTAYGDICPCVFMHIAIGNIREHALRDIRKNALRLKEFTSYPSKCLAGKDYDFIKKYVS